MTFYQVHYTHGGDRKIHTISSNGELEEVDVQQTLVQFLNLDRRGAESYAEVLQRNHVTVDHWHMLE